MDEYIEKGELYRRFFNGGNGIVRVHVSDIDTIPAADVAPVRHGRWDKAGYDLARCSFCHTVRKTDFARDHYCPNCGAKMDGEEMEK